ncbi:MAG: sigma factor-like helix-turn-helix DNA-binding protein [Victivallaceae bacterium]|nr:sigma factor-like helix-turn-helix DNA-binding protein [Victivallaceae bacterium]
MKPSNKKSIKFVPYKDNGYTGNIDFDYGAIEKTPVFEGYWGECLRNAVNSYLKQKIFDMFEVFETLTERERRILLGREVFGKSFRKLGRELAIDHKTVQAYHHRALAVLRNSPLRKVETSSKNIDSNNKISPFYQIDEQNMMRGGDE